MWIDTQREWIEERTAVLDVSTSPEDLETSGVELASSDDPKALEALAAYLRKANFLEKLDPPDSSIKTLHLARILLPLIEDPSPDVARLCLGLVDEPFYLEHDRKSLVLEAMAAVSPMDQATAEAFQRANGQGYFSVNALQLAQNGSPAALELFRSMMGDTEEEAEGRVELLHKGILPYRTRLSTLVMVNSLMSDHLEEPVLTAAIESVFDYRPEWFTLHGPTPPLWRTADTKVLQYLIDLGDKAKALSHLSTSLQEAIENTTELARALLATRKA